jgi:hypothetical protein
LLTTLMLSTPAFAQRVAIPSADPYAVPNPYAAPAAAAPPTTFASPYPTTPYTGPAPTAPPPTYAPAAVGPPPTFDPYAVGGSVAPAPPLMPYSPAPAPVYAPTYGQPVAPLAPPPAPYAYQPPPYDINTPGPDYWGQTQKLLQELSFEYTYLYAKHSNPSDFGYSRAEISTTFAFPMFYNIQTPLLVTPGFAVDWLQGPIAPAPDLPPQLYDAYLDTAWYPHPYDWLGFETGFRIGVYSDFHEMNRDSLRLMGRAAASLAVAPNMDIVLGAAYLDRLHVKILPVAGIYYRPTPDWDMYLVFPNPKVRKFMASVGTTKWWWYAAGEYGGGSWTVDRSIGPDQIDYNDIRVIGGLEWETQSQIRGHVELGYVFDREILFRSGTPEFDPNDTFMFRVGVDF